MSLIDDYPEFYKTYPDISLTELIALAAKSSSEILRLSTECERLKNEYDQYRETVTKITSGRMFTLEQENAALNEIIECAKTPLMADVLKENSKLEALLKEIEGVARDKENTLGTGEFWKSAFMKCAEIAKRRHEK